jgi:hypothetical protein
MKKYLNTDFRKFIVERLKNETKEDKPELEDDLEMEDETPEEVDLDDEGEEIDDDVIDELLNEYKKIKKKHELYKFHRRKK